ncbi:hypothetical protein [Sphingomonas sp. UYP23]
MPRCRDCDLVGVRARAIAVARDLIAADAASGMLYVDTRLSIADDSGVTALDLAFTAAVAVISGPGASH